MHLPRSAIATIVLLLISAKARGEEPAGGPKIPAAPKAPEAPKTPKAPEIPEVPAVPEEPSGEDVEGQLPPELSGGSQASTVEVQEEKDSSTLTIEEIVNEVVESASARAESSRTAPAWIITITADQIRARGYLELTELLDDLPGMDVVRPWGDTYVKSYWRGYRNYLGSAFLLMIDGMPFNQLWLNDTDIMAAFPLTNVEQVEVVYGPASALYGPNAAMGVINVITRKDVEGYGAHANAEMHLRGAQRSFPRMGEMTKVADMNVLFKSEDFRVSLTGRFEFGLLEPSIGENFEWTKNKYYANRSLWGDFVDYPSIAGGFNSPVEKQAVDARLFIGGTEVGVQFYRMLTGGGVTWAADRLQASTLYVREETNVYVRHEQKLSESVSSKSLLRYRKSDVVPPTTDVERVTADSGSECSGGLPHPCIRFQYWEADSFSFTAKQDFDVLVARNGMLDGDETVVGFGLIYERRDLERQYLRVGDDWDPRDRFDDEDMPYTFPRPVDFAENLQNRNQLELYGAYGRARYNFLVDHYLHLGFRLDYNALFGRVEPTFRGGYVGRFFHDFTVKALYGQAIQEPTWRELFGAWNGISSFHNLKPERSQTFELNVAYSQDWLTVQAGGYVVHYADLIESTNSMGLNLGSQLVVGGDISAVALIPVPAVRQLRAWAYYSPYIYTKQSTTDGESVAVPDLAYQKLLLGATVELTRVVSATLLARCIGARDPVKSNPLGPTDAYCTADANLLFRDLFSSGLAIGFRVTNILDAEYFHPGLVDAGSGDTPGRWENGEWIGSGSYYNSRLPQPRRAFTLEIALEL